MTKEQIREIEARANAATPGPWNNARADGYFDGGSPGGDYSLVVTPFTKNDAAFVSHARDDVPSLIAEIRRLQALAGVAEA